MLRTDLADLNAFLAVAEDRNFTRAAARLGVSQSALSHTVRRLEERLGVRLLTPHHPQRGAHRGGQRLVETLAPALDGIADRLASLSELREKPAGTIRITASEHATHTRLWPALERLLPDHPDVNVELSPDSSLRDIVADRFDAGVRLGESLAKDMIATRIGPDLRMAVVGSPAYFARRPAPRIPQDLAEHRCINLRLLTAGSLYAWELEKDDREVRVRVKRPARLQQRADDRHRRHGGLRPGVRDGGHGRRAPRGRPAGAGAGGPFSGYHLYYPSRRQPSAAFTLLLDTLRRRSAPTR